MKTFATILPLVSLAVANGPYPSQNQAESCTPRTITKTATNTITFTVPAHTKPSSSVAEPDSTKIVESTVWVVPSPAPQYPYPNGSTTRISYTETFSTLPISVVLGSSSIVDDTGSTVTPLPAYSDTFETLPVSVILGSSTIVDNAGSTVIPVPTSSPDVGTDAESHSGKATYYSGDVSGGMCSFNGGFQIPSGLFGTALSDSNWDVAQNCGACVSVTGPDGNKITAMVVDQCPGCGPNRLDLFPDAFAKLADPVKGVIPISWTIVPCGITSPIVLKNKEGTSQYWFSMQVMNSNVPVSKLEVSTDNGATWQATERQPYNYFQNAAGFGTSSVDVKVTSTNGGVITVKGVSIEPSKQTKATSNFS